MYFYKKSLTLLLVASASFIASAEDAPAEPKGLTGSAEFGMVVTSGNTDNSTTTGKFELSYDTNNWLHFGKVEGVTAETDNVSTAERYLLNLKSDYKLLDDQFLFVGLGYDVDKFSGFDYQSTVTMGYGRNIFTSDEFKLSAEIGPGYRKSKLETGETESESIVHLGAKSKYTINEASHIAGTLNIDSGEGQTISILDLGYVNKLNASLALKVGFNIKRTSDVPVDVEKTDRITSVSLLYSFK